MNYLTSIAQIRLQQAFHGQDLSINIKSDHIILENSKEMRKEKIQQIIEKAGFCPLISEKKINGNFAFTITPYRIPEFFRKPVLGQMIEIHPENREQKRQDIEEILGKKISSIRSFGKYSATPRNSTEFEKKAAEGSAMPNGTCRYAHAFENKEPITINWLLSQDIVIITIPKVLWEQHGRCFFQWFSPIEKTFWFGSAEDYFITLRPNSKEDLKTGFWKGSIEERIQYWQKEFIEKDLFGSWIDHWDCLKEGMKQPMRMNLKTMRTNYSYESGLVFTFKDLLDPNILSKDLDLSKNNPQIFKLFN